MAMSSAGISNLASNPNVTPLIDVLMVLLIIFMVITPTTPHGLHALVPQPPKHPEQQKNDTTIVVQITARPGGGPPGYKINQTDVSHAQLLPELQKIYAERATKVMFIKGDANLDWAPIADVIDIGHEAAVDHIGIITPKVAAGE